MSFPPLIDTAAVQGRLGDPTLAVLDASWYLPNSDRNAYAEYLAGHLPGARFFDLDATSDHTTPLPHMLPTAEAFEAVARELGISAASSVVVYDGSGVNLSAARVWWMFRAFGHERVAVLDGGLGAWRSEGRPLEVGAPPPRARGDFGAVLQPGHVRSLLEMETIVASRSAQVVDARPAGRFRGIDPEPRAGVRSGHMPGSLSLPYADLVDANGRLRSPDALRERLHASGVDLRRPVVATCGSGTSACAVLLALEVVGAPAGALYDGAWTEWGGREDLPVERS
ncbi:MAG: 3-mercaptopyruvate sulfurtransferase [Gemmatimonadales bacterium]